MNVIREEVLSHTWGPDGPWLRRGFFFFFFFFFFQIPRVFFFGWAKNDSALDFEVVLRYILQSFRSQMHGSMVLSASTRLPIWIQTLKA